MAESARTHLHRRLPPPHVGRWFRLWAGPDRVCQAPELHAVFFIDLTCSLPHIFEGPGEWLGALNVNISGNKAEATSLLIVQPKRQRSDLRGHCCHSYSSNQRSAQIQGEGAQCSLSISYWYGHSIEEHEASEILLWPFWKIQASTSLFHLEQGYELPQGLHPPTNAQIHTLSKVMDPKTHI